MRAAYRTAHLDNVQTRRHLGDEFHCGTPVKRYLPARGFSVSSKEALIKVIPGFIRARYAANAVCGLLQNQSLGAIDFAGTSLCRGKV